MEEMKKINTISKIVGILVQAEINSLEATKILDEAKSTFLERSWHISSSENKRSPQVAATTSEEKVNTSVRIEIPKGVSQKDAIKQLQELVTEMIRNLPIDF